MSRRTAVGGLLNHALLHCNIGSCTLKPIAWVALRFPNDGWRRMENPGWEHYICIFKFPGGGWKLELALGPFVFVFPFPPLFLLVWLTLVTGLHNFIRLGLMNHSSSEATVRDCRPGRVCVSVTKKQKERKKKTNTKKTPHSTKREGMGAGKKRQWANSTHGQLSDVWSQTTSSTFICKTARPPRKPKRLLLFIKLDVAILRARLAHYIYRYLSHSPTSGPSFP